MDSFKVKRIVSHTALFFLLAFILVFLTIVIWSYVTEVENLEADSNVNDNYEPIDELTISSINSRILSYKGKNKGREIKRLIDKIDSINNDFDLPQKITYSLKSSEVKDSTTYSVDFKYDNSGCICDVIIEEN